MHGHDFAYVDADKDYYMNYHERLMKLVKVGGLIVYDNTLWQGTVTFSDSSLPDTNKFPEIILSKVEIVKETNKALAADPRIQMSQLSVADGVTICMHLHWLSLYGRLQKCGCFIQNSDRNDRCFYSIR